MRQKTAAAKKSEESKVSFSALALAWQAFEPKVPLRFFVAQRLGVKRDR